MARLYFITHTLILNTQLPSRFYTFIYVTHILLLSFILTLTSTIPLTPPNTENYLPSDNPNITNLMVSHYDCEKQHNLRQFNLLNVKPCTEAPSNIQHAKVRALVYVRAKAKRINAYKWNQNTMPLPVTLDPFECKNIIIHLIGTNIKY